MIDCLSDTLLKLCEFCKALHQFDLRFQPPMSRWIDRRCMFISRLAQRHIMVAQRSTIVNSLFGWITLFFICLRSWVNSSNRLEACVGYRASLWQTCCLSNYPLARVQTTFPIWQPMFIIDAWQQITVLDVHRPHSLRFFRAQLLPWKRA